VTKNVYRPGDADHCRGPLRTLDEAEPELRKNLVVQTLRGSGHQAGPAAARESQKMGVSDALTLGAPLGGGGRANASEYETLIVCTRYVPNMYRIEIRRYVRIH
jgi:hypothetical protein